MTDSSYEEATRCPKCSTPGNVRIKAQAPRAARLPKGTQVHTVYCENRLCRWYETCWVVQVNADGSVPPAKNHTGQPKVYQGRADDEQLARDIMNGLSAQVQRETNGGAEIRRRG